VKGERSRPQAVSGLAALRDSVSVQLEGRASFQRNTSFKSHKQISQQFLLYKRLVSYACSATHAAMRAGRCRSQVQHEHECMASQVPLLALSVASMDKISKLLTHEVFQLSHHRTSRHTNTRQALLKTRMPAGTKGLNSVAD